MDPFTGVSPAIGAVRNYVTTYDGTSGFPLHQSESNGSILFSGELRPRAGQNGVYEADFVTYDSDDSDQDYGSFRAMFPTTDQDGNGLADFAQKNKSGNGAISGRAVSDLYGTVYSIAGSLSRPANAASGSYSVTLSTPGSPSTTYNGSLYLLGVSGSITYSRRSGGMTIALVESLPHGRSRTLRGFTYFTVVNSNQIKLPQFKATSSDGFTYTVFATTFNRSGNKYIGNCQLADGLPETYWRDFINFVVEITDANDTNHDGIPDLSDPSEPKPKKRADFNGDGQEDILWQNTDGSRRIWLMNGGSLIRAVSLGNVHTPWSIAGAGDFNGDGQEDILWQKTTGECSVWFMSGTTAVGSVILGNVAASWRIAGAGDFNGDGKEDILWQNTNGARSIWLMNGATLIRAVSLGNVAASWSIAGAGDFNGDGKEDILWQNTNGARSIWLMNGTTLMRAVSLGSVAASWSIAGAGDFNSDGQEDILWQNTNGARSIWLMNGTTHHGTIDLGIIATSWSIQNH